MNIEHLSDHRVIVSRLQAYTGSGAKRILTTLTAVWGSLQGLSPDQTMAIQGVPGKTFVLYCDSAEDIQEDDQLRDSDGNIYTVRKGGVTKWQHGTIDYLEAYLTKS